MLYIVSCFINETQISQLLMFWRISYFLKFVFWFFLGTAYFHQKECLALSGNIANWVIPSSEWFLQAELYLLFFSWSAQWVLCSPQPLSWHTFISVEAANLVGGGGLESIEVAERACNFRDRKEENKAALVDLKGLRVWVIFCLVLFLLICLCF